MKGLRVERKLMPTILHVYVGGFFGGASDVIYQDIDILQAGLRLGRWETYQNMVDKYDCPHCNRRHPNGWYCKAALQAERDAALEQAARLMADGTILRGADEAGNRIQKLEAQLKAMQEAMEPLRVRLDEADQAKQLDKHIGLIPDDWTTWVRVGDLRRLKEVCEDKD